MAALAVDHKFLKLCSLTVVIFGIVEVFKENDSDFYVNTPMNWPIAEEMLHFCY